MHIGKVVTVHKQQFRVAAVSAASTDPKFWGRRIFVLIHTETGETFRTSGKTIAHNARLEKVTR